MYRHMRSKTGLPPQTYLCALHYGRNRLHAFIMKQWQQDFLSLRQQEEEILKLFKINENGLVVEEPENPDNFAEKISNLLSNKSLMKKMGERGRELSVSQYQWDRVASELLKVWEDTEQITLEASPATSS